MLNKITLAILFLLLCFTISCSNIRVSQDYNATTVFSNYTTFNWFSPPNVADKEKNPLLHSRFQRAIETQLHAKGISLGTPADILVSYTYSVSPKIQSHSVYPTIGFGYGSYGRYGSIGFYSSPDIYQYDQRELVINIYDARDQSIIWRGKGTDIEPTHPSPEQTTAQVDSLVATILDQFPPTP